MREVTLTIAKLGLIVGDVIKLQLINSVGAPCMSSDGYSLDLDITLTSDTFSITIHENEHINMLTFYKLTLPSGMKFNFSVPYSFENIAHDLLSLLQLGCYEGIINKSNNTLDERFVQKLDNYFTGENAHFSKTELDVVRLYEYYASEVISTSSTVDVFKMMDEYLATITGAENA